MFLDVSAPLVQVVALYRLDAKKVASPLDVIAPLLTRVAARPEAKKPESAGDF